MKAFHVLVCAGFLTLACATRVQAAQAPWLNRSANDPGICSLSLEIESCTSRVMSPSVRGTMPLSVAEASDGFCMKTRCALADIDTPDADSSQDGWTASQPADNINTSSGPSDRAGYYLLGAIPLIVGVGGLIGIDHRLPDDNSGIWKRSNQLDLEYGVILTELGGALWYGGESRIGRTFWQSIDASTFSALTVQALKYGFSRARPYQSASPNHWFQGSCCQSFPSGEVTLQASFVTPFILEYHREDPWVWGLEALPLYDALARMKTQGHWQTDVLSGWALGTAFGVFAHNRNLPFFLSVMPHGMMLGWHTSF